MISIMLKTDVCILFDRLYKWVKYEDYPDYVKFSMCWSYACNNYATIHICSNGHI